MSSKTVFALWADDGYYYPATIGDTDGDQTQVIFLDGSEDWVGSGQILELDDAYATLNFEGDWEKQGGFYPCTITRSSGKSVTVAYDEDGIVEKVDLVQLRGLPGKKKKAAVPKLNKPTKASPLSKIKPGEQIAGKYWFIAGGGLLALFGLGCLINNLLVSTSLGALPETANGWDIAFRIGVLVLPVLLIISGALHILTGLFVNDRMFTVTNQGATRLNTLSIFLLGGFIAGGREAIAPYLHSSSDTVMWGFLLLLILVTQVCFIAFEINEKAWEDQEYGLGSFSWPFVITRIASRLLIILILIPILRDVFNSDQLSGLPPLFYAFLGMCQAGIFNLFGSTKGALRRGGLLGRGSMLQLLKSRAIQIGNLVMWFLIVMLLLHPLFKWIIYDAPVFVQIIAVIILLLPESVKGGAGGGSQAPASGSSGPARDAHTVTCSTCGATIMAGGTCTNCANHPTIFG